MSEINYEKIHDDIVSWYHQNNLGTRAFPKNSPLSRDYFNDIAETMHESKFEKFDLARFKKGEFSSEEFLFFISEKHFVPRNKTSFEMGRNYRGHWAYGGYIFEIKDSENAKYKTSTGSPEKLLDLIYSED